MYFVNLIGKENIERKTSIPVHVADGTIENAGVYIKDDAVYVAELPEGETNLFMKGLQEGNEDVLVKRYKKLMGTKLVLKDLEDTEDNPLILVYAKGVRVYSGVKTYIKYINVGENVLAMLVYGACEMVLPDGTVAPLQRCYNGYVDNLKTYEFRGKDLANCSQVRDAESGYIMSDDIVNAVIMTVSDTDRLFRSVKEHISVFYTKNVEEARVKEAKRLELLEAKRKQKEEERRKAAELRAEKERIKQEHEAAEAAKALEKSKKKRSKKTVEEVTIEPTSGNSSTLNVGAAAFLKYVQGMKK